MFAFIARRLLAALLVVFVSSFVVYILMTYAGDPLAFLIDIQDVHRREVVRRAVVDGLSLDEPRVIRYWNWLVDLVWHRDFGISARTQLPISGDLKFRIPMTLKLVGASTVLSIIVGIAVGIVTAIRQYSGFDYLVSFFTFVFFSLPVFWVAIILKDMGGINFNDWLRDSAQFSTTAYVLLGLVAAIIVYSSAGGAPMRKLVVTAIGVAAFEGLLIYVSTTRWLRNPGLGPIVVALLALGIAVAVTAVMAGWRNEKARNSALTTAAIGAVLWWPMQAWLDHVNLWKIVGLAVLAVAVGVAVAYAWGGYDKGLSARTAGLVAFLVGAVIFVDQAMQSWDDYSANPVIRNRPIRTLYDKEARLEGSFWIITNNTFSHLILPTLALMLISVATYTRYSRGSMLEVLNQDYIRTARSKGLTERTVVIRHGLRNAMIPLATIVAFDIGGVLGGAVITESVFEWNGMGSMFIDGLRNLDPNPVMAFFLIIASLAVIFNLIADLVYAALDPRIRLVDQS